MRHERFISDALLLLLQQQPMQFHLSRLKVSECEQIQTPNLSPSVVTSNLLCACRLTEDSACRRSIHHLEWCVVMETAAVSVPDAALILCRARYCCWRQLWGRKVCECVLIKWWWGLGTEDSFRGRRFFCYYHLPRDCSAAICLRKLTCCRWIMHRRDHRRHHIRYQKWRVLKNWRVASSNYRMETKRKFQN